MYTSFTDWESGVYLEHHGIKGMSWGQRRWQNEDGSLTTAGLSRYSGQHNFKQNGSLGKNQPTIAKSNSNNPDAIVQNSQGRTKTSANVSEQKTQEGKKEPAKLSPESKASTSNSSGSYTSSSSKKGRKKKKSDPKSSMPKKKKGNSVAARSSHKGLAKFVSGSSNGYKSVSASTTYDQLLSQKKKIPAFMKL